MKIVLSGRTLLLISSIFLFMSSMSHSAVWRDEFDDLSQWNGEGHSNTNGITTLTAASADRLITSLGRISQFPTAIRFRAKPADGTPNYASLRVHLFTDESGSENQYSYALHMTGDYRGHFKVTRAGYKTEYYSGGGFGLLIGPGEWQEVEMRFYRGRVYVYRGDEAMLDLALPDLPDTPEGAYVTLHAQSGVWDFDWIELDTPDADCDDEPGGGDDGGENQPPTVPTNLQVSGSSANSLSLIWDASEDDSSVAGYVIYRDQTEIARTQSQFYTDTNLSPETQYSYQVAAFDDENLLSDLSDTVTHTTDSVDPSVVEIQAVQDQIITAGNHYSYSPQLAGNQQVVWLKAYGPDDLVVDTNTGSINWIVPANTPAESFYVGVTAVDKQGNKDTETWIVSVGENQNIIYVGPNEIYKSVADGIRNMNSGDTVIVRNGTYSGTHSDFINANEGGAMPPSGTETAFTTVMAEEPGKVIFDGQNQLEKMIDIAGNYNEPENWGDVTTKSTPRDYIAIKGFHVKNSLGGGIRLSSLHHAKLTHVGVSDSGRAAQCDFTGPTCGASNIYITRTHHVLLEDVYTFGHARYQIIFQKNRDGVVRRAVSRIDGYIGQEPVGVFQTYCSKDISWQNVIAIDSDSKRFWVRHTNLGGSLGFAATGCSEYPTNNQYHSSIALNNDVPFTGLNLDNPNNPHFITNSIGWGGDMTRGLYGNGPISSFVVGEGVIHLDQLTMGRVDANPGYEIVEGGSGRGFFYHRNNPLHINNSIVYQMGWDGSEVQNKGRLAWSSSEINFNFTNFFNNSNEPLIPPGNTGGGVSMLNNIETDPTLNGLKYLPRIESGSVLESAGASQVRVGANIVNRLGKSGTFVGDEGWNIETTTPLWPYPQEELIKQKFANYSYTGPTRSGELNTVGPIDTIAGNRGFAADGNGLYGGPITLTSYIWEQLGHACPQEICIGYSFPEPPTGGNIELDQYQPSTEVVNLNTINSQVPSQSSGITWHDQLQQYLVVHNNHAKVTRYDASFQNYLGIISKGGNINSDMEGLAYAGGDQVLVVAENNRAHKVSVTADSTIINGNETVSPGYLFPAPTMSSKGMEAIAIRSATENQVARIYAGEEGTSTSEAPYKLYYFDLESHLDQPNSVNEPYAVNAIEPFNALEKLGSEIGDFSGMYYDEVTGHLLILSQVSSKLIEVHPETGEVISSLQIDKTASNVNWEGVTLGPNREIVVVGEPYYVRMYIKN